MDFYLVLFFFFSLRAKNAGRGLTLNTNENGKMRLCFSSQLEKPIGRFVDVEPKYVCLREKCALGSPCCISSSNEEGGSNLRTWEPC